MRRFKVFDVNEGHCQITYWTKNNFDQRIFYCLQDNHGIRPMRCTQEGEPEHEVVIKNYSLWDIPQGDSKIEIKARQFLQENLNATGSKKGEQENVR